MANLAKRNFEKFNNTEYEKDHVKVEEREDVDMRDGDKKIWLRVGDAMDTLKSLKEEGISFDFIFIDADKKR